MQDCNNSFMLKNLTILIDCVTIDCCIFDNEQKFDKIHPSRSQKIVARLATSYRVFFLTVPPNFQYQNEKRWAANQIFRSMKFLMYKASSLVEQRFSF